MTTAFAETRDRDKLKALIDSHWSWVLQENPILATEMGNREQDGKLYDLSLQAMDRRTKKRKAILKKLRKINPQNLSVTDRLNQKILLTHLKMAVRQNDFGQRKMLFTNRWGWHLSFAGLADRLPFFTNKDYRSYILRMRLYPKVNDQGIEVTRKALAEGYSQPCESMRTFAASIKSHIVDKASASVFYTPFKKARPKTISQSEWVQLKDAGAQAIEDYVIPAYRKFHNFYVQEYHCRDAIGIDATPGGADYYKWRVRAMTTTDLSPDAIHKIGLREVARIRGLMDDLVREAGFDGNRLSYIKALRNDIRQKPKSARLYLMQSRDIAKQIDEKLPGLFGHLPRMPFAIKPVPDDIAEATTAAYYEAGAKKSGRAGVFRLNTSKLDERYLFELPALTMHEAVPGHHLQIALQQELEIPLFRRGLVYFTAFVEGWGLYSESLGVEMGLYDTPEKKMGQLSYEMWRACRLVVDTGIHSKGWSRRQAIDFMKENTALSEHNITSEVDRYITWPGQALAYKIGELKFKQLRRRAEKALGAGFDIRKFHDAVLNQGAIPLSILEQQIDAWIDSQRDGAVTLQ